MLPSFLAQKYYNAIKNNSLDASILVKLPKLVNCPHWDKVEIMGQVDYTTKTNTHYNGALVRWDSGLYFVSEKVIMAIQKFDKRFRNIKNKIRISS